MHGLFTDILYTIVIILIRPRHKRNRIKLKTRHVFLYEKKKAGINILCARTAVHNDVTSVELYSAPYHDSEADFFHEPKYLKRTNEIQKQCVKFVINTMTSDHSYLLVN